MDRRSFLRTMLGAALLPFLPQGLGAGESGSGAASAAAGPGPRHEVWLQSSRVAGFQYYEGDKIWRWLKKGEPLTLSCEPENLHDARAVEVHWRGRKLGYVPRYENRTISELLASNVPLVARISFLEDTSLQWKRVEFDIFLLVAD